jgi:hypothetical protein
MGVYVRYEWGFLLACNVNKPILPIVYTPVAGSGNQHQGSPRERPVAFHKSSSTLALPPSLPLSVQT